MNERLLILAAEALVGSGQPETMFEARGMVSAFREEIVSATQPGEAGFKTILSDCDAWLAAADRLEERDKMIERFREKVRNAPVLVLSDEERANLDRIEAEAKEQGYISNGEMLLGLLTRARADHDRVKSLPAKWRNKADEEDDAYVREAVRDCSEELENALDEPTDTPISDPAERAKAVAKELRRRGLYAVHGRAWVSVSCPTKVSAFESTTYHLDSRGREMGWDVLGPLAVADRIQAEEAKRAKTWAGDT